MKFYFPIGNTILAILYDAEMELFVLIGFLSSVAGFLSGMLGIGGGIIMAPLLLYAPPLLGFSPFQMRTVAGLTIIQGLAACLTGAMTHKKFQFVSFTLTCWMGGTIFFAALIGGAAAGFVSNSIFLMVFALLAFVAAPLVLVPTRSDCEQPEIKSLSFSRLRAVASAGSVGLLGGLVGQGGSFILIPLMTSYLQIPTRIAIGSNLAIVFLSSLAAFLGKAATGQIVWFLAVPVLLTVIPSAYLGSLLSRRMPVVFLRLILSVCIAVAALRIGIAALGL
jgi:uncharacterized membrane protein YfcA